MLFWVSPSPFPIFAVDDLPTFSEREIRLIQQHLLPPLPADPTNVYADQPDAALLGQFIFFSREFSKNRAVSCATCHQPQRDFTDGLSVGIGLAPTKRHTPSLWNMAYQRWFFWDGRKDSLWSQALEPFEDPREFAQTRTDIVAAWYRDDALRRAYHRVFGPLPALKKKSSLRKPARPNPARPDSMEHKAWMALPKTDQKAINQVFVNLGKALAAYQRQLVTTSSPFDRFAKTVLPNQPNYEGLLPAAQRGLKLFLGKGRCRLCHAGPLFSDGEFHDNGVPDMEGRPLDDGGRYDGIRRLKTDSFRADGLWSDAPSGQRALMVQTLTRSAENWGKLKTPSLRNVARTAPYMSRGQMPDLRTVLSFYSSLKNQVIRDHHGERLLQAANFSVRELDDLRAFLISLSSNPPVKDFMKPLIEPPFRD